MRLTSNDRNYIIRSFPNIKLSYVKNIHKKVSSANIFLAIPKGKNILLGLDILKGIQYACCLKSILENIILNQY